MHVSLKLTLKAHLACCNEGTKKSLENVLILQNKTESKTSHFPSQRQPSWKKKYGFMSNRHSSLVNSVNIAGVGFRKGDDN